MTIAPEVLDALLAAGATAEMIVAAVKADSAKEYARRDMKRAADAERQRRSRASRNVTVTPCDNADVTDEPPSLSPAPSSSPDPSNNPTPTLTPVHGTGAREARAKRSGFAHPDGVGEGQWRDFLAQRRKALTQTAYARLTAKLEQLADAGWPPGEMIDLAIERGWETVFEPKDQRNGQPSRNPPREDPIFAARRNLGIDDGLGLGHQQGAG